MICPECLSTDWEKINCGDIIVDKCKKCHGIWFDGGEFNLILEKGSFYADNIDKEKDLKDTPEIAKKCPRCKVAMKRVTKNEIRIDVCRDCSGIWADEGEFFKLSNIFSD